MGKTGGGRGTNQHAVKGRSREAQRQQNPSHSAATASVHAAANSEHELTSIPQAGDRLPAAQQNFIRSQPDEAFREMSHDAVRNQRKARSGMIDGAVTDDGETSAYVITEMADRGLDAHLNEILEPDAGDPATDYTVTTHRADGTTAKATFESPSDAVLFAHGRHSEADPDVEAVSVSAHNSNASRTVLAASPATGLRFVLPPPGNEMSEEQTEQEITRLEGRLDGSDPMTRRRVIGRLDDLYRRELG